ncbi:hypothetical protein TYRP_022704, partial [Tyrophagus putrescentiae]
MNNLLNPPKEDIDILSVKDEEFAIAVKAGVNLNEIREYDPLKHRDGIIMITMRSNYGISLDDKVKEMIHQATTWTWKVHVVCKYYKIEKPKTVHLKMPVLILAVWETTTRFICET